MDSNNNSRAFKRYFKEPLSKSLSNDISNTCNNEINNIISKINYKFVDNNINSISGKKFISIDNGNNSSNNSIYTDNDDNNTIVTINSYNSHHSNNNNNLRDPNKFKAIQMMKIGDYKQALNLLDNIVKSDNHYIDYKLIYYKSVCLSNLKIYNHALDEITLSINIIESEDKQPNVKLLLQLAKCQSYMKLYNEAILTLLRAHQENERGFQRNQLTNISNDNNNIGNYKIKINDMLRKVKRDMRDYSEKKNPLTKEILPIIEYRNKQNKKINATCISPSSIASIGSSRTSPNTTVSSISYDSYDSSSSRPNSSTLSLDEERINKNDVNNSNNNKKKNFKLKNSQNRTKTTLLPSLTPKIKSNFPKYKAGLKLRAVIEQEKESKQELFKKNRKAAENISYFVNLLGTLK